MMIDDLTSDFTQKTFLAVLEKNVVNSGSFRWKKPGMFFIDYTGSQPKQYISNNKKMWIYVPGDTQAEVYSVSQKTISKEVLEFMRGFVDIKKNYRITGWKKKGRTTSFTLVPRFRGAPYARLQCHFRSDHLLDKVTIYNVTGNISTYNFSNIRINTGLASNLFKFKRPKGVKIVRAN
jgi:outer membrane lipoprotein carrier protein